MNLSLAVQFNDIPIFLFKYLYEHSIDSGDFMKFNDIDDPIDYNSLAIEYLNDLAIQIIDMTNLEYVQSLLDTFIKFLSISNLKTSLLTSIQADSSHLVYKVSQHCLTTIEEIGLRKDSRIATTSYDAYSDFHNIIYDNIISKIMYVSPLITDTQNRSLINMQLLKGTQYMTCIIDRFYIMLSTLHNEI